MTPTTYPPVPEMVLLTRLNEALAGVMRVEAYTLRTNDPRPEVQFVGRMLQDTEAGFALIEARFAELGYTPLLTEENGQTVLYAFPERVAEQAQPQRWWINAGLFVLTLLAVLLTGAMQENVDIFAHPAEIWRGWPFAAAMMGILTVHELSHYFVGRRYGSPLSLPYFIPLPVLSIFGTMGAVIVQRAPMRNRKALFDIGAAGPIGGLLIAVPLLFFGLAHSEVGRPEQFIYLPPDAALQQEGNSLLYLGAKWLIFGRILPDKATGEDVWLSPPSKGGAVAFAAWAGLLVTALNLFPIGQLDGGHIAYALWGRKAWRVAQAFIAGVFSWGAILWLLGNPAGTTWLVWGGLGALIGPRHPPPLDDLTPLDARRRWIGWALVGIFLLIVVPIPLTIK